MKERRRGPIGRATGIAESMGATVRRLQRDREPRALVYDASGDPRLLQPASRGYDRVIDVCERMVTLVDNAPGPTDDEPA
jgi:hypothetical protein